jgi:hypothetical protein
VPQILCSVRGYVNARFRCNQTRGRMRGVLGFHVPTCGNRACGCWLALNSYANHSSGLPAFPFVPPKNSQATRFRLG